VQVKQGDRIRINDREKGSFTGVATGDFDTEADEFFLVAVDQDTPVESLGSVWQRGEPIPVRRETAIIEVLPAAGETSRPLDTIADEHRPAFDATAGAAGDDTVTVTTDPANPPAPETAPAEETASPPPEPTPAKEEPARERVRPPARPKKKTPPPRKPAAKPPARKPAAAKPSPKSKAKAAKGKKPTKGKGGRR
jgi:hypothetical protein